MWRSNLLNFVAVSFPYSEVSRGAYLKMNSVSIFLECQVRIGMNGDEPRPLTTPTYQTSD